MKIEKIYIASPLNAPTGELILKNMKFAERYKRIVQKKYGVRVFAPHSYLPTELDDNIPEEREIAIKFGQAILNLCDAIAVFTPGELSAGMKAELLSAREKLILAEDERVADLIKTFFRENGVTCKNLKLL